MNIVLCLITTPMPSQTITPDVLPRKLELTLSKRMANPTISIREPRQSRTTKYASDKTFNCRDHSRFMRMHFAFVYSQWKGEGRGDFKRYTDRRGPRYRGWRDVQILERLSCHRPVAVP